MATKLVDQKEILPELFSLGTQSLTSYSQGIQRPVVTNLLVTYLESFSSMLARAEEDAEEDGGQLPSPQAAQLARSQLESWLRSSLANSLHNRTALPVIGATLTHAGFIELVFRDLCEDRDRVLWISRDAKSAKQLEIDEELRLTRQITEQLW